MTVTIKHLGCAGHFIGASKCGWRRHTQIDGPGGSWRVSSVGEYRPTGHENVSIGFDRTFETMVFATSSDAVPKGCGCREVSEWCEVDSDGYNDAGKADAGHEAMVAKYATRAATRVKSAAKRRKGGK